jgi:hypothetical protein
VAGEPAEQGVDEPRREVALERGLGQEEPHPHRAEHGVGRELEVDVAAQLPALDAAGEEGGADEGGDPCKWLGDGT